MLRRSTATLVVLAVAVTAFVAPLTVDVEPDAEVVRTLVSLDAEKLTLPPLEHGTPEPSHSSRGARTTAVRAEAKPPPAKVAGLNRSQTSHARVIVEVGREMGMSERALVVAIATALQESTLRNLANPAHPSSFDLSNDGVGYDHDSVGIFQQRPASGWGTVKELMTPEISAKKFYNALKRVSDWEEMSITRAAQRVQKSAYPDAYAKHEKRARQIVDALS
jgi:hypothetical protein